MIGGFAAVTVSLAAIGVLQSSSLTPYDRTEVAHTGDATEVRFVEAKPEAKKEPHATRTAKPKTVPSEVKTSLQQRQPSQALVLGNNVQPRARKSEAYGGKGKSIGVQGHLLAPGTGMLADTAFAPPSASRESDLDSGFNTEGYDYLPENVFKTPAQDALSTFSIDVDTASYANIRRFVHNGSLPPKDAVRIEEMVNYFPYAYAEPENGRPFAVHVETAAAPWKAQHRLVKIGLKGKSVEWGNTPSSNLVFLIDVSGSMESPNKLPLLRKSLKMLVERLGQNDRVAIVVYAGASGLALPSTSAADKQAIMDVLDKLSAGGSTNGGEGIRLAYKIAQENFIKDGLNRVIIATDGDFNVGTTSQGELVRLIEEKAQSNVFLSVLGYGMGNFKDNTLEKLAAKGNGNYAYIDSENEARKVLVEEIGGTMMTIAKDVKIQVEFNPAEVEAYRLIGYENRILAHQDFNDDKKDAGDIGAGHTVTAFYEVVPKGVKFEVPGVDALKYQKPATPAKSSGEMMTVKLRYKKPDEKKSSLIEYAVRDSGRKFAEASADFRFAAAVAGVGMVLRESQFKAAATFESMLAIASEALAADTREDTYRTEFVQLLKKMKTMNQPVN